MYFIVYIYLT